MIPTLFFFFLYFLPGRDSPPLCPPSHIFHSLALSPNPGTYCFLKPAAPAPARALWREQKRKRNRSNAVSGRQNKRFVFFPASSSSFCFHCPSWLLLLLFLLGVLGLLGDGDGKRRGWSADESFGDGEAAGADVGGGVVVVLVDDGVDEHGLLVDGYDGVGGDCDPVVCFWDFFSNLEKGEWKRKKSKDRTPARYTNLSIRGRGGRSRDGLRNDNEEIFAPFCAKTIEVF